MSDKQALKARIKSIKTTHKITSAMELIANAKLSRSKNVMEENHVYASALGDLLKEILNGDFESDSLYLKENENGQDVHIIISSDMGLCGSYNANVLKEATTLPKDEPLYVLGTKLYKNLLDEGYQVENDPISIDALTYEEARKLTSKLLRQYQKGAIKKIDIIYTHFKNGVSFEVQRKLILPLRNEETKQKGYDPLDFEPEAEIVLDDLIESTCESVVYALILESKTSEQASRRLAMENASDNAEELQSELTLAYNQARQAAITQEITEIVAGADAL